MHPLRAPWQPAGGRSRLLLCGKVWAHPRRWPVWRCSDVQVGREGRARDGEIGPGGWEGAAEARRPESRGGRVSKLGVQGDVLTLLPGAEELGTRGDVGGTLVPATRDC